MDFAGFLELLLQYQDIVAKLDAYISSKPEILGPGLKLLGTEKALIRVNALPYGLQSRLLARMDPEFPATIIWKIDLRAEQANRLSEPYRNQAIGALSKEQRQRLLSELLVLKNMHTLATVFGDSMGTEEQWRSTDGGNSHTEEDTIHDLNSVSSGSTLVETSGKVDENDDDEEDDDDDEEDDEEEDDDEKDEQEEVKKEKNRVS